MNGLRNIAEREEDLKEKKGNAVRVELDFREKEKVLGKKLHNGVERCSSWCVRFLFGSFRNAAGIAK